MSTLPKNESTAASKSGKFKALLFLPALCIICALGLALSYQISKEKIADQKARARLASITEIFPAGTYDNDLLASEYPLPDELAKALNVPPASTFFVAIKDSNIRGVILPSVTFEGYSGRIAMLVGVKVGEPLSVQAVRVTEHRETPGLGDKITLEHSDWITSFNGLSLNSPPESDWQVRPYGGVFDAFTGATVTPAAVVTQVAATLNVAEDYRALIFTKPDAENSVGPIGERLPSSLAAMHPQKNQEKKAALQ